MLGQRRRRWANIKPPLGQRLVSTEWRRERRFCTSLCVFTDTIAPEICGSTSGAESNHITIEIKLHQRVNITYRIAETRIYARLPLFVNIIGEVYGRVHCVRIPALIRCGTQDTIEFLAHKLTWNYHK